ncbi:PH domain-containing protein [Geodermatophilus pulveris]|uniref:PH domain-containing protein n=1 Tax=Geodermatophilus pulveris TaxID=1564159 RepID=A0A239FL51_9ACTN|nr:PH domain-containing protein [Geodermatophilus pulveris]SNS57590.1 PH domain-containing protein [Geodermatophilus pulveris]
MQWSPPAGQTAVLAAAGVLLAGAAVLLDPLGRVLVGGAAVLLLALAARERLLRPRLAAGPAGVAVRRLGRTTELPWATLRVRVRDTRRLGLRSRLLELDTAAGPDDGRPRLEARPELARGERDGVLPEEDGVLVLLGRLDLGADPAEVARALGALRPR